MCRRKNNYVIVGIVHTPFHGPKKQLGAILTILSCLILFHSEAKINCFLTQEKLCLPPKKNNIVQHDTEIAVCIVSSDYNFTWRNRRLPQPAKGLSGSKALETSQAQNEMPSLLVDPGHPRRLGDWWPRSLTNDIYKATRELPAVFFRRRIF